MSLTRTGPPSAGVIAPGTAGAEPYPVTGAPAPPGIGPHPVPGPPVQVVPVRAIPVALAAIAALVATIAGNWIWGLDFFHVAAGALWTGIDLFVGLIVGPIIGRMSIPARVEFSKRFMPKMVLLMPTLVVITLAAGWQVARHLGNLSAAYPHHGWVVASMVVVGVMAVVALGLLEPANLAVLFEFRKPAPNGELIAKLMRRFIYAAGVTGVMQVATLIIMSRLAT